MSHCTDESGRAVQGTPANQGWLERFYAPVNYNGKNLHDSSHVWKNVGTDAGYGVGGLVLYNLFRSTLEGLTRTMEVIRNGVAVPLSGEDVRLITSAYDHSSARGIGSLGGTDFTITYDAGQASRIQRAANLGVVVEERQRALALQQQYAASETLSLGIAKSEPLVGAVKQGATGVVKHGWEAAEVVDRLIRQSSPGMESVTFNRRTISRGTFGAFITNLQSNNVAVSSVTSKDGRWKIASAIIGAAIALYLGGDFLNDLRMGFNHDPRSCIG